MVSKTAEIQESHTIESERNLEANGRIRTEPRGGSESQSIARRQVGETEQRQKAGKRVREDPEVGGRVRA